MCGISGVFEYGSRTNGRGPSSVLLETMASTMAHRGPDDGATKSFGPTGFGFRRLSIIDLEGGRQPIGNEDETIWVEGNGEIYNYRELRQELIQRGHRFRTDSDTETILHGYEEWDLGVVDRLNGIFGFAIWDSKRQRLLLARDHLGVKPLYWHDDGSTIRWGSELRAVLADTRVRPEMDVDSLRLFLHFGFVPSPHTLVKGVSKLRPGHLLVADRNGVEVRRYWNEPPETRHDLSPEAATAEYSELFSEAVKRQMISDVPVGVLLSGGVDSGMVLAAAARESATPISTFTVGFGADFAYDEAAAGAETARFFGADHHPIHLDINDFETTFEETVRHLEEPVLSQSTFAFHLMTAEVEKHVKVVLTGQGADEPWAGYDRYLGERYSRRARWLFRSTVAESVGDRIPRLARFRRATSALGLSDPVQRFAAIHEVFGPEAISTVGKTDLLRSDARAEDMIEYWQAPVSHLDELNQLLYVDTRMSLPDDLLFYGDKLSMSHSVEARVPLLDRTIIDAVETMPSNLKLRGRSGKYVHKKVAAQMLPESFVNRKKFGFATPVDEWFASDLGASFERTVLAPSSICSSYLDRQGMRLVLEEHRSGRRNHRRKLTTLLSLELAAQALFSGGSTADDIDLRNRRPASTPTGVR